MKKTLKRKNLFKVLAASSALCCLSFLYSPKYANARRPPGNVEISLSWKANTEPDIADYIIYKWDNTKSRERHFRENTYETKSLAHEDNCTDGRCSYTDPNIDPSKVYSFVVTATDTCGLESGYSNEVNWTGTEYHDPMISSEDCLLPLPETYPDANQQTYEPTIHQENLNMPYANPNKITIETVNTQPISQTETQTTDNNTPIYYTPCDPNNPYGIGGIPDLWGDPNWYSMCDPNFLIKDPNNSVKDPNNNQSNSCLENLIYQDTNIYCDPNQPAYISPQHGNDSNQPTYNYPTVSGDPNYSSDPNSYTMVDTQSKTPPKPSQDNSKTKNPSDGGCFIDNI